LCALAFATLAMASCKEEKLPVYDDVSRVYFYWTVAPSDSPERFDNKMVSLGYDTPMKADSTFAVRVRTMGRISDVDRTVKAEIVVAESTAKVGEDIEIVGGTVAAGARDGYIYVKVKNTEKLLTNTLYARIRLVPNENFHVDWSENGSTEYRVRFDAKGDIPNLWNDAPLLKDYFGEWSRVKEMTICEVLGIDREFFTYDQATENAVEVCDSRIPQGLAYGMIGAVNRWLRQYRIDHDDKPLLDENGKEVKMGKDYI
jgi:hypothetical protein